MAVLFLNAGRHLGVMRFDSEGFHSRGPGYLGHDTDMRLGGKQMSFMPGDIKGPVPEYVEIEWVVAPPELQARWDEYYRLYPSRTARRSAEAKALYKVIEDEDLRSGPAHARYTRRVDLRPIITPDLIAEVRADRKNTLLKLIITFNNENVDITAVAEKWR
jgi:hypothetical protein